ncbi:MAG TPA: cupin domain-containing protein [Steroidobacteraceae bacterium]|nr:cupin domain-containing protein [Steroidobacteraceae bacterium]
MTLAYYDVAVNSTLHEHSHSNEEVWNVIKGQLKITIDGKSKLVGPGGAAIIPPNTPHAVRVMKKARILVVDAPRRSSIGGVEI